MDFRIGCGGTMRNYDGWIRDGAAFVRKLSGDGLSRGIGANSTNAARDGNGDGNNFNLSHFFLVKESLPGIHVRADAAL